MVAASWAWAWAAATAAWALLIALLHRFKFLGAGRPFLEQILKTLIIGARLGQLRLGLGTPARAWFRRAWYSSAGQGDQGVSRLHPGAGLHPDFAHPAGHLGRDLGQALGDDLSQDFQLPGNHGLTDDQHPARRRRRLLGHQPRGDLAEVKQPRQPGHEEEGRDYQGGQADDFILEPCCSDIG